MNNSCDLQLLLFKLLRENNVTLSFFILMFKRNETFSIYLSIFQTNPLNMNTVQVNNLLHDNRLKSNKRYVIFAFISSKKNRTKKK